MLRFTTFFILVCALLASGAVHAEDGPNLRARWAEGSKSDKAPLFIRSETLNADAIKRVFVYRKNVELTRGDLVVTSDLLTGNYNEKNEIETITFNGNVVITRGEELRASSELAVYNVKGGVIELTQNPEVSQNGNVLAADKVNVYVEDERSEAIGNVHVKVWETGKSQLGIGKNSKSGISAATGAGADTGSEEQAAEVAQ